MKKEKENGSDKLKDFLYDNADYFVMAFIILGVILVINWRVGNMFKKSNIEKPKHKVESKLEEKNEPKEKKSDLEDKNKSTSNEVKKDETEKKDKKKTEKKKTGKTVLVSIPKGAVSYDVAEILEDLKLIKDKKAFEKYVQDNKLETKLRYGNFKVPEGSTVKEIISILVK